jgi:hypothetical protein
MSTFPGRASKSKNSYSKTSDKPIAGTSVANEIPLNRGPIADSSFDFRFGRLMTFEREFQEPMMRQLISCQRPADPPIPKDKHTITK